MHLQQAGVALRPQREQPDRRADGCQQQRQPGNAGDAACAAQKSLQ
ncbi:hypothetical protein AAG565_07520 [Fontimonas sp. SYSU GA230001]